MIIRVEPSLLQGLAAKMQDVGGGVSALGSNAASAAEGAPSYDGQFGPLVWPIGAEANSRTSGFTTQLVNLSDRLGRKALEFERADNTTINGLISTSMTWPAMAKFLARWSTVTGIPVATLERYLKLGTLFGSPSSYGLLLGMVLGNNLFSWTGQTFMGLQRPSWWPQILWPFGQTKPETPKPTPTPAPSKAPTSEGQNTQSKPPGTQALVSAIGSLDVENAYRYQSNRQNKNETYCNLFVTDFAKKMGVDLPDGIKGLDFDNDGTPDDYIDANELVQWLSGTYKKGNVQTGPQLGWSAVSSDQAAKLAGDGYVVVTGWENPNGIGHVAVVRPESTADNIIIAQAGASNFESGALSKGFGNREVEFFVYKAPK